MSLFGGDSNASSAYDSEHSQLSSTRSSPSIEPQALPSAQPAQHSAFEAGASIDAEISTGSESETDESDEEQPTRPNRFQGAPHTWKRYTAADRQIAAFLDQIRDGDLSAHLYNAHALKSRVRLPPEELANVKAWQSRENWQKKGSDLQYTDISGEIQTHLVPSKDWTAWPLPPDRLSPSAEHTEERQRSLQGLRTQDAGDEMREQLLATFLRIAKDNWNSREAASETERGRTRDLDSRSRSRSKSAWSARSHRSASRTDVSMKDGGTEGEQTQDEDQKKFGHVIWKSQRRMSQPEQLLQPVVLADDARALRILQPTMNSVLSQLDRLALAVRRTRMNHFAYGAPGDRSSQSDFTSGAESTGQNSRSRSRSMSRKRASKPPRSRSQSRAHSTRPGTKGEGTKTQSAKSRARARILDRHMTSSDSDSSSDISPMKSNIRKRGRSDSAPTDDDARSTRDEDHRLGLIDWSEVLGLAAVTGWDQQALSRTAQRCAALFGESMSFIPIPEGRATQPAPQPIQYTPSTVPAPTTLFQQPKKRPFFQPGTLRCPHADCYGHEKDVKEPYRVIEHCIRVHKYDPRTNNSDNEERTVGGVHIDGFLQPIVARQKGKGRLLNVGKRKKLKVDKDDEESADNVRE